MPGVTGKTINGVYSGKEREAKLMEKERVGLSEKAQFSVRKCFTEAHTIAFCVLVI